MLLSLCFTSLLLSCTVKCNPVVITLALLFSKDWGMNTDISFMSLWSLQPVFTIKSTLHLPCLCIYLNFHHILELFCHILSFVIYCILYCGLVSYCSHCLGAVRREQIVSFGINKGFWSWCLWVRSGEKLKAALITKGNSTLDGTGWSVITHYRQRRHADIIRYVRSGPPPDCLSRGPDEDEQWEWKGGK